jgi:hypothetical protein
MVPRRRLPTYRPSILAATQQRQLPRNDLSDLEGVKRPPLLCLIATGRVGLRGHERFRDIDSRFERLYAQNEKREQEYLFIKEQLSKQEQQLSKQGLQLTELSKELRRHT